MELKTARFRPPRIVVLFKSAHEFVQTMRLPMMTITASVTLFKPPANQDQNRPPTELVSDQRLIILRFLFLTDFFTNFFEISKKRQWLNYVQVRRADGTYGSDREFYQEVVEEYCPEATATYPTVDKPIVHDDESAVSDGTKCTTECGGEDQPACNRKWSKKNLRRRWHEAGRIKNGRMGSLSGVLKGELMLWGGECYGGTTVKNFGPDGNERSVARVDRPRPCRMQMLKNGSRQSGDYIEAFSFIRMNKAGYLFGEPRVVDLVGYHAGQVSHDESAVSQAYSAMNAFHSL